MIRRFIAAWQQFWILTVRGAAPRAYIRWACMRVRREAGDERDAVWYLVNEAADVLEGRLKGEPMWTKE